MAPPPEAVRLVEFREGHLDELVPLWRASFERGVGIVDPHPIADQIAYFRREVLPHNAVRVAFEGDTMVGFVSANPQSVAQLYVRCGCQGRGLGRLMLAWAKGQSSGTLWLHAFECNTGARAFYEREGFRIVERGFVEFWGLDDLRYEWRRE